MKYIGAILGFVLILFGIGLVLGVEDPNVPITQALWGLALAGCGALFVLPVMGDGEC